MRLFLFVVALLVAPVCPVLAAAPAGTLNLGVFPYLSPTQMVEQLEPLRQHIETTLGKPVALASAPDFIGFVQRTQQEEYDLVFLQKSQFQSFIPPNEKAMARNDPFVHVLIQDKQ